MVKLVHKALEDKNNNFDEAINHSIDSFLGHDDENLTYNHGAATLEELRSNPKHLAHIRDVYIAMLEIWDDAKVQECFTRLVYEHEHASVDELQLDTRHFMTKETITSICESPEGYALTDDDMLHFRFRTSGSDTYHWKNNEGEFSLIDVGGQIHERHLWKEQFGGLKAILYIIALDDYHKYVSTVAAPTKDTKIDGTAIKKTVRSNKMAESLRVFKEICFEHELGATPILLLFNKVDLFQSKINSGEGVMKLGYHFKDYMGENNDKACLKFIEDKYKKVLNKAESARAKSHQETDDDPFFLRQTANYVTCATDVKMMMTIWDSVVNFIIVGNLQQSGYL